MDTDFQSELAERVARDQRDNRLPSLAVAVGVDAVQLAEASVGYADVDNQVWADSATPYRIGSITKTFTAALTLSLCQGGELALDSRVDRYLPGTRFGHLPLSTLLSHSSGLQREVPGDMWTTMQGPSASELYDAFDHVELVAEPGHRWHYSNLGYAVIGQIIERVTGSPCEALIDQRLLNPLDLARTTWKPSEDAAVGYRLDPYADRMHREPAMDQATVGVGGQLWSTSEDLLRWGHALCGGEPDIVTPTVVEAMHRLQIMVDTTSWGRGWGLGLILERHGDRVLSGHTGAMPGFQSAISLDRTTKTVVAALTNVTRGIALNELTSDVVFEAIEARPASLRPAWQPAPPCPEELHDVLGSWWTESDETILRWCGDGLHAHLVSSPATTDTRFVKEAPGKYRAIIGRLQGELLIVTRTPDGIELRWATYPLTRTPR
ncbi:serine hydrolase [Nocardia sp. SYP-A9097]|uniref:serine hydrolase domain-containing protein n=1 Tax=Nocardia sp. SYP-A9097 TaxID=2663237 RepID=UPI0018912A88|nr:serine hydrolase domain-containing protein [Nocardia sp. SYP-A9097]